MVADKVILKKNVFWSMLEYELPIPLESQEIYTAITGKPLEVGGHHDIKLILDGKMYDAYFRNEGFDRNVFDHSDIIMLSYGANVRRKLKEIFAVSYDRMLKQRTEFRLTHPTGRIVIEENNPDEYILLCATSNPDVFALECVTSNITNEVKEDISTINEEIFEQVDENAGIILSSSVHKVRKLDRSIGDSLKKLYEYRCQMTGEKIGDVFGCNVVEAHHIDPFTKSLNNNYSNIIIVSPNYHRIIHQAKPEFDFENLEFIFPNGLHDKVLLNKHLGK